MTQALTRHRQRLAGLGLFGNALFVAGLVVLHATAFGHEPAHMSQFANSRYSGFWVLSITSLIVGTLLVVLALKPCLADSRSKKAGLAMLALAGLGGILVAAFRADSVYPVTLHGTIHGDAALATFVLLGAAMVVLVPAFHSSPSFSRFAGISLLLGVLVTISWILYLVLTLKNMGARGPVQRLLVAFIVLWFTMLALRLRKFDDRPTPLVATVRRKAHVAEV